MKGAGAGESGAGLLLPVELGDVAGLNACQGSLPTCPVVSDAIGPVRPHLVPACPAAEHGAPVGSQGAVFGLCDVSGHALSEGGSGDAAIALLRSLDLCFDFDPGREVSKYDACRAAIAVHAARAGAGGHALKNVSVMQGGCR